jgi:type I restriction enzyme S subunit
MRLDLNDIRYSGKSHEEISSQDALLLPGDLLFTRYSGNRNYVGTCARVPDDVGSLTYPDKLIRVRVPIMDTRYLAAAFSAPSVRASIDRVLRTTAGQVGISGRSLKDVRIPIAPLSEQRRIVAVLEDHLSRLDIGSVYTDTSRRRIPMLRSSLLAEAWHSARTQGAPWRSIGEIAHTQLGKMLDSKRADGISTEYLRNVNVRWQSFDLSDLKAVPLTATELAKFDLKPGDIMVCEGGEPGRCAVWRGQREHISFQKALHRIRVHSGSVPEWVSFMLEYISRSGGTKNLLTGSTIKHLPQEKLRSIQIPMPEIERQVQLVNYILEATANHDRFAQEISRANSRSLALRSALLSEAFEGRLVPQDSSDEPASVLLKRIRADQAAQPKPKRTRRSEIDQETLL